MSRDLTIRLLGRPQVTVDKRTGFSKVSRRYVVQGPRATLAGISDSTNPLFLAAGTADEEFTDYYLVDQSLAPASGTLDKAYLVREYLQLSSSAISEAFQQSNDLIRVRKRFAVLRNDDANLGYGSSWSNHPSQATTYAQDPWEYAPSWVADATPGSRNYTVDNADDATQHGFSDAPQIEDKSLGTYVSDALGYCTISGNNDEASCVAAGGEWKSKGSGEWLKGYAVMSQAGSGLDIWTVEWVTHAPPYWALGTGRGQQSRGTSVTVLDMDENGMFVSDAISTSGSVSYNTRSMSYIFFVKAAEIPSELAVIRGGSRSFSFVPMVRVDYSVTHYEEEKGLSTSYIREVKKGCVWDGPSKINSVTGAGGVVELADESGKELIFDWDAEPTKTLSYSLEGSGGSTSTPMLDDDGNPIKAFQESDYALFQGKLIKSIHGKISWTTPKSSYMVTSASGTLGQTRTQITPIFSHGSEKIWKVAITYVGG